jgi:hypothetical protein
MNSGPVRVLYIAGFGRSGSTLVARLLGSVPGVFDAGELRAFWRRGLEGDEFCGCGETILACPFWLAVIEDAFSGLEGARVREILADEARLARTGVTGMRFSRALPRYLRGPHARVVGARMALVRSIARVSGARMIVDSSKTAEDAALLAAGGAFDLRLLHLVRDSRAVAYSWSRVKEQPRRPGDTRPMPVYTPEEGARRWLKRELRVRALRAFARPSLFLRYEDFVEEPERWLRRILEFAGMPPQVPARGGAAGSFLLGVDHTVLGNPMRFDQGEVAVRRDDRWQTGLESASRRAVTARTWPLLAAYGYIAPPGARAANGSEGNRG